MQHYVTLFDLGLLGAIASALVLMLAKVLLSVPPKRPGWTMVMPAPLHWTAILLSAALFLLIGYVWLFIGSSRADGMAQMRIAFWLCAIFGTGGVIAAYQTMRIMKKSLCFRGGEIMFRNAGEEQRAAISDAVSGERRWGGEFRFRFGDGTILDVDPYARNADRLIDRFAEQLGLAPS